MLIKKAETGDIPELLRLLMQVNDVHAEGRPDLFRKGCTKYTADDLEELINGGETLIFVGTENGSDIMGYAFCEPSVYENDHNQTDRREIYIDDICVDEKCRGKHVGTALYEYVRAFAAENGYTRITLNVWEVNPAAEAFYRSLGMKVYKLGMEELL